MEMAFVYHQIQYFTIAKMTRRENLRAHPIAGDAQVRANDRTLNKSGRLRFISSQSGFEKLARQSSGAK